MSPTRFRCANSLPTLGHLMCYVEKNGTGHPKKIQIQGIQAAFFGIKGWGHGHW